MPEAIEEARLCLAALVAAVEAGELTASAAHVAYLRGALASLEWIEPALVPNT